MKPFFSLAVLLLAFLSATAQMKSPAFMQGFSSEAKGNRLLSYYPSAVQEESDSTEADSTTKKDSARWNNQAYISLGSTFDFKDKLRANEFYADAMAGSYYLSNKPDFMNRFGFHTGIYHLETVTLSDSTNQQFRILHVTGVKDSFNFNYVTAESELKTNVSLRNLGFFFEPKIRIFDWERDGEKTMYLGLAYRIEYINSLYNYNLKRSYESIDTTAEVPEGWPRPYDNVKTLPGTEERFTVQHHNLFFAPGLTIMMPFGSGYVEAKGFIGKKHSLLLDNSTIDKNEEWTYIAQFVLHETKEIGFKIGADIRGGWITEDVAVDEKELKTRLPFISVYLAKELSLEKWGEFLKP